MTRSTRAKLPSESNIHVVLGHMTKDNRARVLLFVARELAGCEMRPSHSWQNALRRKFRRKPSNSRKNNG
jgi:hypothetical protein